MQDKIYSIPKAQTPGDLADKYGVNTKTLKAWIDLHRDKIGKRVTRYYTPLQVQAIYDCLEPPPGHPYRD